MKGYFIIFICILLTSCIKESKTSSNFLNDTIKEDSMSSSMCIEDLEMLPYGKVVQIDQINIVEKNLQSAIESYKDSIADYFCLNYLNKDDSLSLVLDRIISEGELQKYYRSRYLYLLNTDLYSFNLFFAEKYKSAIAYYDVFYFFYRQNYINYKNLNKKDNNWNEFNFKYLSKSEQNLAIFCLIKAYKHGSIAAIPIMSYYFKEGLYFPKNIRLASKLDSIYEHHPQNLMK